MKIELNKNTMMREAQNSRFVQGVLLQTLIFIAVYIATNIIPGIIQFVYMLYIMITDQSILEKFMPETVDSSSMDILEQTQDIINSFPESFYIVALLTTAFSTIGVIFFCKVIEKRSISSMGMRRKYALKNYGMGALIGFIMFSSVVLINIITGSISYRGINQDISIAILVLFLVAYIFQGMNEEVLFRGYFMVSLTRKKTVITAVIVNSVVFAIFHLLNSGVTVLAVINLVLYGAFASIYVVKMDDLWGVCAIHTVWNFLQGNFYGFKVSGSNFCTSLLKMDTNEDMVLINGGNFGAEGGLGVTIVLTIVILIMIFKKSNSYSEVSQ